MKKLHTLLLVAIALWGLSCRKDPLKNPPKINDDIYGIWVVDSVMWPSYTDEDSVVHPPYTDVRQATSVFHFIDDETYKYGKGHPNTIDSIGYEWSDESRYYLLPLRGIRFWDHLYPDYATVVIDGRSMTWSNPLYGYANDMYFTKISR